MRLGHSPGKFRSHAVDSYLVDSADLILTATKSHRSEVLAMNPKALRRAFTLVEFAALCDKVDAAYPTELAEIDIGDPYRRSPEIHRQTADQIADAVRIVGARLDALAH